MGNSTSWLLVQEREQSDDDSEIFDGLPPVDTVRVRTYGGFVTIFGNWQQDYVLEPVMCSICNCLEPNTVRIVHF